MIINTNVAALNAWRNLEIQNGSLQSSLEKLSSGKRINKAADDAAGLAISEKMISQINGLNQSVSNAQTGITMIQTAEGALNETTSIIQRLKTLATQASNGTETDADRTQTQKEVSQLLAEVGRIASTTTFNTKALLDGTVTSLKFQIGAQKGQTMSVKIATMTTKALSINNVDLSTATKAMSAIAVLGKALSTVSATRANLGAVQNRLEHTVANLQVASENLSAANSQIRDVDMALEMANYTKTSILVQSGTAMLAQANQSPQSVLKLLG
jgi:flagellin